MSYHVRIENTDHEFSAEGDESVLEAALRHGLVLPYSCRGGTCASCAGKVVEGAVTYPSGRPPALTLAEETVGQALFCQARPTSDLVIEVREVRSGDDIQPRKLPCRVARIDDLAHDVRRLWLRTPGDERLQFLAGQYIDILLRGNRRRGFSLANPPHDDELLEVHVRHIPGGAFSGQVFDGLEEGALLRLEGPLGNFFLRENSERPILMIGGGTGFAPLKGIIEHAIHIGVTRPIRLYWGVRALRDLYLDALPRQWAQQHSNIEYIPVLSEPRPEDEWQGRIGLVHNIALADHPDVSRHDVYMCGPPGLIAAARRDLAARGLDIAQLYYDSFEYAVDTP